MKKISSFLFFLLLISPYSATGQEVIQKEKRVTFYPVNLPYVIFGRLQTSVETDLKNSNNSVLVGAHYNRRLDYYNAGNKGSGLGFELQYRVDFNKDTNLVHRDKVYYAPYFEYDYLNYEEIYGNMESRTMKRMCFGLLTGVKRGYSNGTSLDLFYGISLCRQLRNDYNFSSIIMKGGIQIGLK